MKIIKQWKEFLEWREFLDYYQEIDLTKSEISKLEALGDELKEKLLLKTKNNITNKVISENLSVDYIK